VASSQGPLPLLYAVEKGDSGYLAAHQEKSSGTSDALPFSKRLFRGLTLLSQKGPGELAGFTHNEILIRLLTV
jgi:hypothetical protein